MMSPRTKRKGSKNGTLEGQLLVAMPVMTDKRFARSVIYMCAHSDEGAMGLIINHRAQQISFPDLLDRLGIAPRASDDGVANDILDRQVHFGGPVETGRGFVLHTDDYHTRDSTLAIAGGISLTATIDILKAIAQGRGPRKSILALGYAGWSPGQLESEIQANGWLNCPAHSDIIFEPDLDAKYERALSAIGVNPSFLVSDAGHC
ncbi:MAG: YqgE/AlgH family protein [Hyphomicrobium sp.]|nr:YqgE/AlgH family protein [Hyphomicrobium sp.]